MYKKKVSSLNWYLVNAKNKILGRLASKISIILMGKNKSNYLPNINIGDYVVVINASKILVTGNKKFDKIYYSHSGYVGNLKSITFKEMLNKSPEYIIKKAIKGMLPKNILGNLMLKKLKIYSGYFHKHGSQKPILIDI